MRAIFISYRRDDSEGHAGRLFKDLVGQFGPNSVFMDVAGIEPGRDFRRVIDDQVASCGVLLAMIGKDWLDAKDESGRRRLDDPSDFVRLETAAALKRDIPVIPVLVQGASMPHAEQLPDDLANLAYRNGVELTHARWDSDVQLLIKALRPHVDVGDPAHAAGSGSTTADAGPVPKTAPYGLIAAGVAVLVVVVGGFLAHDRSENPAPEPPVAEQPQSEDDALARAGIEAEQARQEQARLEQAERDQALAQTEAERARAMAEAEQARNEAARAKAAAERAQAEAAAAREEAQREAAAKERAERAAAARAQAERDRAEAERIAREREREVDFSAIPSRTYRIGPVTVRNIRFDPFPPSVLAQHQEVSTRFAYDVCCGHTVNIWVRPVWNGSQCSYGASGSPAYSGTGTGTSNFSMRGTGCRSAVITGIRFSVKNQASNDKAETVVPVKYTFH